MTPGSGEQVFALREVVAVFDDPSALETAIERLEISGVDRAAISVMSSAETIDSKLGHLFRRTSQSSDADNVEKGIEVSRYEMAEGVGAVIAIPVYIGATAALVAIFASGGWILAAAVAGLAGGAFGGGFGAVAARMVGKHHADHIEEQLTKGGLLLWVRTTDDRDEKAKIELLRSLGGANVHGHIYRRKWGSTKCRFMTQIPTPF
ncbi:hypothetical protein [Sphingomonas paeninsulae]|uniref:hypothetical protein n=1 Tax=Sphingomonas paeninsulae TaxID=2319844 RepID=UPI0019695814|nr:hypothetical protein [Sphingomonas paeninsulae]